MMMMQREKRWIFYSSSLCCTHPLAHEMVYIVSILQNRQTIASSGNHCHQLVLFRKILPGFIRSTNSITMSSSLLSLSTSSFLWYNSVVIDVQQPSFYLLVKLIKIINNEKWQWCKNNTPTSTSTIASASASASQHQKQQTTELFSFYIIPRIVLTGSSTLIHVQCTHYAGYARFLCGTICTDLVHHVMYWC